MKNQNVKYMIVGIFIGGLLVWLGTATVINTNSRGMMSMMGIRQPAIETKTVSGNIDAHFIEQMIPHHEDAITMAKLALERSQHEGIRTLSKNIIDSQSEEIDEMKSWYKKWYGRELPTGSEVMKQHGMMGNSGMHMGMMGDKTDLEMLQNSVDFDREFLQQMIPHHQMAVMMASMLRGGTQRPEMEKLADDIIAAQTEEIDLMRDMLRNMNN